MSTSTSMEYTPKQMTTINSFIVNYHKEYSRNPPVERLCEFLKQNYGVAWNMRDAITRRYFENMMENATSHLYKKRRKTQT